VSTSQTPAMCELCSPEWRALHHEQTGAALPIQGTGTYYLLYSTEATATALTETWTVTPYTGTATQTGTVTTGNTVTLDQLAGENLPANVVRGLQFITVDLRQSSHRISIIQARARVVEAEAEWERTRPEREAAERRAHRLIARRAAERKKAERRAERLLLRHLNRRQRDEYAATGRFHIVVPSGRIYRIQYGKMHNVFQVQHPDDYETLLELCVLPANARNLPECDVMLAQMLWLLTDEEGTRDESNIWAGTAINRKRPMVHTGTGRQLRAA
jgi:hypothetical protein